MMLYEIARVDERPSVSPGALRRKPWSEAAAARVTRYHAQGSGHEPKVEFRALYDGEALYVHFRVTDRFVRCIHTGFQDPVCRDSCCELFIAPEGAEGYFNIEMNAVGALMISYITDPTRTPGGFAGQRLLGGDADRAIQRDTSLRGVIDPETAGPVEYEIGYRVPFALIEDSSGRGAPRAGERWRGNIYKCSENSSHPHWGAWSAIGDKLDFHQPDRFGVFVFG